MLDEMEDKVGDTRALARIIFEIIYKHYESEELDDMLSKLEYKDDTKSMSSIDLMRREYNTYVDIYDRTTMDWFHGNNIIANFIINKRNRENAKKFLSDLEEQTGFPCGLSAIYFLESCSSGNNCLVTTLLLFCG